MRMFNGLSGKTSIMRVLVAVIVITVLINWVVANIVCWTHNCGWINIGTQEVALILGALAAKAGQRLAENGKNGNGNVPTDKTQ